MSIRLFSLIAIMMFAPDCGTSSSSTASALKSGPWSSVRLTISGGFTGRGNGVVFVTPDGKITIERPPLPGKQTPSCEGKLSAEDLKILNDAVSRSHPDVWKTGELNVAAPDAFGYELELTIGAGAGAKSFKGVWYDNTRHLMSEDLKAISDAVSKARKSVEEKCK